MKKDDFSHEDLSRERKHLASSSDDGRESSYPLPDGWSEKKRDELSRRMLGKILEEAKRRRKQKPG